MEETEDMPEEGVKLRNDLEECFQDISCFLLPYPGDIDRNLCEIIHSDSLFAPQEEVWPTQPSPAQWPSWIQSLWHMWDASW